MTPEAGDRVAPRAEQGAGRRLGTAAALWNTLVFLAWVVTPFELAGPGWIPGWAYLATVVACALAHRRHVAHSNPGLLVRRARIGLGTKPWDLAWCALFWPLMASIDIVAALQGRQGGGGTSLAAGALGFALVGCGFLLSAWAMGSNPWFEATVRIQAELGHRVFEGGPYRRVRHPGYLGLMLWALGTPLVLLSTWAAVPALVTAAWIVLRTVLEDATLRRELPGYAAYASRTSRFLPGVW